MLVVTPSDATARWAAQSIDLGGGTWRALVVGPEGIPVVTDVDLARREPHLAVLSVLAHGRDDDVSTSETQRQGFAEGKAAAVLVVLEGRGLSVSADQREQILRCSDGTTIDAWLRRSATVQNVDQLLA